MSTTFHLKPTGELAKFLEGLQSKVITIMKLEFVILVSVEGNHPNLLTLASKLGIDGTNDSKLPYFVWQRTAE